jgi:UDP-2,4-diacetamido-2,4,6-trideoxy-beta-L-altropyranose hydrolase
MRIAILADSGPTMGLGHVARCVGLAQGFEAESGIRPTFYVQDARARRWVRERGFAAKSGRPEICDLMIVDSYHQTAKTWAALRQRAKHLLVVDDFGRPYPRADWVLNSAPLAETLGYSKKWGNRLLLGPTFHPLRRDYWRSSGRHPVSARVRNVVVLLGGGRMVPALQEIVSVLKQVLPDARCHVVLGPMARVRSRGKSSVTFVRSPKVLRRLLERCDLAVSAAGQTLYELAFAGLPTVAVQMAANQRHNLMAFEKSGTILPAGWLGTPGFKRNLTRALITLLQSKTRRQKMSQAGRYLVDGRGARRVAQTVLEPMAA